MKPLHICEVCGKTEILKSDEAYERGWDYPPRMDTSGVVSQRTCPHCTINKTAWWALAVEKKQIGELDERQRKTIRRILGEPESVIIEYASGASSDGNLAEYLRKRGIAEEQLREGHREMQALIDSMAG